MEKPYEQDENYIKLTEEINNLKLKEEELKKTHDELENIRNKIYEEINKLNASLASLEMKHYFTPKKKIEKEVKIKLLKSKIEKKQNEIYHIEDQLGELKFEIIKVSCIRTKIEIEIYNKYILPYIIKESKLKENMKLKTKALVKLNN